MNLYLLQHAQARSKEEDPERSLSDAGRRELEKTIAFLDRYRPVTVARIFHSGKTRARQTAEALREGLHPPAGISEAEGLNPTDDVSRWAFRLKGETENIMLVGHLPHLSRLAALLIGGQTAGEVVAFRNAGVVCLNRRETGDWSLSWAVFPDMLT
jgi:phosphohistidine phosphatase